MLVIPNAGMPTAEMCADFKLLESAPSILVLIFGSPPEPSEAQAQVIESAAMNTELQPGVAWIQDPASFLMDAGEPSWWEPDHPLVTVLTPARNVSARLAKDHSRPWQVRVAVTHAGTEGGPD